MPVGMRTERGVEWQAVYAVDWGVRTGVCEWVCPVRHGGLLIEMDERVRRGSYRLWEVGGGDGLGEAAVVAAVMLRWEVFLGWCVGRGFEPEAVVLAQEAFVYNQKPNLKGSDPWASGRLASMAAGWREGRALSWERGGVVCRRTVVTPVVEVQPAVSKRYATSARLRKWGMWRVGLVHGRDAAKVVATLVG